MQCGVWPPRLRLHGGAECVSRRRMLGEWPGGQQGAEPGRDGTTTIRVAETGSTGAAVTATATVAVTVAVAVAVAQTMGAAVGAGAGVGLIAGLQGGRGTLVLVLVLVVVAAEASSTAPTVAHSRLMAATRSSRPLPPFAASG